MQTFMTSLFPYETARHLDDRRLGKQRVEALQIAECLLIKESRWKNHPAVKMWRGYEAYLIWIYLPAIMDEWKKRGFKNEKCQIKWENLMNLTRHLKITYPFWLNISFVESHRSNLIRKKPEHYKILFPETVENLDYIWPVE